MTAHVAAAAGATAQVDACEREEQLAEVARGRWAARLRGSWRAEEAPSDGQLRRQIARRHEPIVTNLDEALWQDVEHEAAQELVWRDGDRALAARAEGDAFLIYGDKAIVG